MTNDEAETRSQHIERMEREIDQHNADVRSRSECHHCGSEVPESDELSWKYAAAGGALTGPFCSKSCYWGFLNE